MSVVPILLCSLVYIKSVSSNIPKRFSAVSSSDPFIVGLSNINNVQRAILLATLCMKSF